jgi:hypothetical protein
VFTASLRSNDHGAVRRKHCFQQFFLLLPVDWLPWEPVCLRSLPSNGSTRYNIITEQDNLEVKLQTYIREMLGSNLGRSIDYVDFLNLSQATPRSHLDYTTTISFQVLQFIINVSSQYQFLKLGRGSRIPLRPWWYLGLYQSLNYEHVYTIGLGVSSIYKDLCQRSSKTENVDF